MGGQQVGDDSTGWPALEWETHRWEQRSRRASVGPAASVAATHDDRYEFAVPPLIATLLPNPTAETARSSDEAVLDLARFDGALGDRVAAFAPVLLRSEAASSSQIENLSASARQVLTAEYGGSSRSNATAIAANTRAMQAAIGLADDLSSSAILQMHEVLMEGQPQHTPGVFRTEAVWIGTDSESPVGATYVAPHHDRVPGLIDDLVAFSHRSDLPALTQVAVAHAQFETIHPFSDGNGRTGRAFAQALLRRRGVTKNVAVPVSAGLLADVGAYHDALTAYRRGDVNPIVERFAIASSRAIANARTMVDEIEHIQEGWRQRVKARSDSKVWPLLEIIARRPVINAATAAEELGVLRNNVYPALDALTQQGVLKSKTEHEVGPFWRSDEILGAIDAFARRAGRRSGA